MIDIPIWQKFIISIILDIADFFSAGFPGPGHILELVYIPIGLALFGPVGLANAWELADTTNAIDAFVPTMTICCVLSVAMDSGFDFDEVKKIKGSVHK